MFEENTKQQEGKITENKRQIDFNFIFNEKQEDIDRPVEHLKKFQMEKYKSSYYKYKKARVKKAYVGPSKIHKYGIFAKQFIQKEEIVTEYLGEIIRNEVADRREIYYTQMVHEKIQSKGFGDCYLFRVDLNYVIDATFKGNEARYLNHSCDPNCASVIVDLDGFKSIVFFAKRNISIGEEITYDYQFESEEQKLKCTCGSKFCQGSLN